MDDRLTKPYNPTETENRIYQLWEESGFFNPDTCVAKGVTEADAKAFTIDMPPPNVTGVLHMGHALGLTFQDIMIRFKRMCGFRTLWLPGTDHAAIATQSKVEKDISKKEGKSRNDLGRDELVKRVEQFAAESHETIVKQIRVMGASCDWSREAFTLDTERNVGVKTMFKRMYEDGLIYQGHRIVNWDPKGQTTIADDEIVYQEEKTKFYYLKYGPFVIGTARPETKFGDKYVVMHPDDGRYANYKHDDKLSVPWINGTIEATIIKDPSIDMAFGTGVMTITPWHSVADFDLAEKYKLDKEQIIDYYGKLLPVAGDFGGMKIADAREKIVAKLEELNLVDKIEDYTHNIATAERTGGVIEPQIMKQWFINVTKEIPGRGKSLKDIMREPVANGQIKIIPDYFDKTYFHWIDNLRDWCISRQIWYGHRIPVWYDQAGTIILPKEITLYVARHGQAENNTNRTIMSDEATNAAPLTEKGRADAEALGQSLKGKPISRIITSNLPRAQQTAAIAAQEIGFPVDKIEVWDDLKEVQIGNDFVGTPKSNDYNPLKFTVENKTGESPTELEARAKKVLDQILKLPKDEKILLVGHGSFNTILEAVYKKVPKENFLAYRLSKGAIKNGSVYELNLMTDPSESDLIQDPDTLDTWFSSGLWSFSTLGWPNMTKDLATYHPTDVIVPAYEILFFWIARMILMTGYALETIPFHTVFLTGIVRDEKGRKFSKSLGNGIDPLDVAAKFGADASRMALVVGTTPGMDSKIWEDKIKAYKHFANKLWNISRFITSTAEVVSTKPKLTGGDETHLKGFEQVAREATDDIENYKFYLAAEKLYHYVWHELADKIIEESKPILAGQDEGAKQSRAWLLHHTLQNSLKLLHPFMPFITEEIWGILQDSHEKLLMVEAWPR